MIFSQSLEQQDAGVVAHLRRDDGFIYTTDPYPTGAQAAAVAKTWLDWYNNVGRGQAESVYYIVAVPHGWAGPPEGSHRYSGLLLKIGHTRNVMTRLANLRTGAPADLIIHALEPGSAQLEAQRQAQFGSDRRQGEWFACSPQLTQHIFGTWRRNNALPPEHQIEIILLQHRIDGLIEARKILGGTADMVNPSLTESWAGKTVLVDLAYSGWRVSIGRPIRPGAIEIDSSSVL